MSPGGDPPLVLPRLREADLVHVAPPERIWRIYRQGGDHGSTWERFRFLGPLAGMRFDHHLPPRRRTDRGVLHGAIRRPRNRGVPALLTCVAETFQDTRIVDPYDRQPWVVAFVPTAPLVLLDLTGAWTTRAGGDQAVCTGSRAMSRKWARAVYEGYREIDGLHYTAAHFGHGHSVVLFERARDRVPANPTFHRPLSDPSLRDVIAGMAGTLGYGLR